MIVHVGDPATRRAIFEALIRLPEPVRRFALEQTATIGVGRAAAGIAFPPDALGPPRATIVLAERDGARETFAHEVAHAFLGHTQAGAEVEREAAAQARSWGFDGLSADPEACVARFKRDEDARPAFRIRATAETVEATCHCGAACDPLAPTVPGLPASVAVACPACGWVEVVDLAMFVGSCPACVIRAVVTWAEDAMPQAPVVTVSCGSCGQCRRLRAPAIPVTISSRRADPEWGLARATRSLREVAKGLPTINVRGEFGAPDAAPVALESCRAALAWARGLLLREFKAMPRNDARLVPVSFVIAELGFAIAALGRREVRAAAVHLSSALPALDAALTAPADEAAPLTTE